MATALAHFSALTPAYGELRRRWWSSVLWLTFGVAAAHTQFLVLLPALGQKLGPVASMYSTGLGARHWGLNAEVLQYALIVLLSFLVMLEAYHCAKSPSFHRDFHVSFMQFGMPFQALRLYVSLCLALICVLVATTADLANSADWYVRLAQTHWGAIGITSLVVAVCYCCLCHYVWTAQYFLARRPSTHS